MLSATRNILKITNVFSYVLVIWLVLPPSSSKSDFRNSDRWLLILLTVASLIKKLRLRNKTALYRFWNSIFCGLAAIPITEIINQLIKQDYTASLFGFWSKEAPLQHT